MEYKANPYKKPKVEAPRSEPDDDDSDGDDLFPLSTNRKQRGVGRPSKSSSSKSNNAKPRSSKFDTKETNGTFDADTALAAAENIDGHDRHVIVEQEVKALLTFDYTKELPTDGAGWTSLDLQETDDSVAKARELRALIDENQKKLVESTKKLAEPVHVPLSTSSTSVVGGAVSRFPKILSAAERYSTFDNLYTYFLIASLCAVLFL